MLAVNQGLKTAEDRILLDRIVERMANIVFAEDADDRFPSTTTDLQNAALKAVKHLISLGHQRIAYIGTQDARLTGYRIALLEAQLDHDPNLIFPIEIVNNARAGYAGAMELISLDTRPTAIFTANDEVACGVLSCLNQHGISTPHDLAIVSVDDIEMASYLIPPLTTVRLPKRELGRQAVSMLIDQTALVDQPPVSVVLPTELIIRESCGYHLHRR